MKEEKVRELLQSCKWKQASSKKYEKFPHSYTLRENWKDKEFLDLVKYMRKNSEIGWFFRFKLKYFYLDNYKYWTMGYGLDQTKLINRVEYVKDSN